MAFRHFQKTRILHLSGKIGAETLPSESCIEPLFCLTLADAAVKSISENPAHASKRPTDGRRSTEAANMPEMPKQGLPFSRKAEGRAGNGGQVSLPRVLK